MSVTSFLLLMSLGALGPVAAAPMQVRLTQSAELMRLAPTALVVAEDERTARAQAERLRDACRGPWTPRIAAARFTLEQTDRARLRAFAAERGADLILHRHRGASWRAVPTRAGADKRPDAALPPEALLADEAVPSFLQAWAALGAGRIDRALEGFGALEAAAVRSPNPDLTRLWRVAALVWAGRDREAESELRALQKTALREDDEIRAYMALILGGALARRASGDKAAAKEAEWLLADTAAAKSWPDYAARAQTIRAKLTLAAAPRPFRADALNHNLEQLTAAVALVDPNRDEVAWAALQVELGLAHLWLSQLEGARSDHAAKARQRLQDARAVWRRRGDEAAAEAVRHILSSLSQ